MRAVMVRVVRSLSPFTAMAVACALLLLGTAVAPTVLEAQDPVIEGLAGECLLALDSPATDPAERVLAARELLGMCATSSTIQTALANRLTLNSNVPTLAAILAAMRHSGIHEGLVHGLLTLVGDQRKLDNGLPTTVSDKALDTLKAILRREEEALSAELVEMVRADEPPGARALSLQTLESLRPLAALPRLARLYADPRELPSRARERVGELCEDYFGGRTARLRKELLQVLSSYLALLEAQGDWQGIAIYLDHEFPDVANGAAERLDRLKVPASIGAVSDAIVHWLSVAPDSAGGPARIPLIQRLLQLFRSLGPSAESETSQAAIEHLLDSLATAPALVPELRLEVCRAAVSQQPAARDIQGTMVVDVLLSGFKIERDEARRRAYVDLLAELGNAIAVTSLLEDIESLPPALAAKILQSMGTYEVEAIPLREEVDPKVLQCAQHPEVGVRQPALLAIERLEIQGPETYRILLLMVRDAEIGDANRARASHLLGEYDQADDLLVLLAEEKVVRVRQAIAQELGRVASRIAAPPTAESTARRVAIIEALASRLTTEAERESLEQAGLQAAGDDPRALRRLGQLLPPVHAIDALTRATEILGAAEEPAEADLEVLLDVRELLARASLDVGDQAGLDRARPILEELLASPDLESPREVAMALMAGDCYRGLSRASDLPGDEKTKLLRLAIEAYDRARAGAHSDGVASGHAMVRAGIVHAILGEDDHAKENLQYVEVLRTGSQEIMDDETLTEDVEELRRLLGPR